MPDTAALSALERQTRRQSEEDETGHHLERARRAPAVGQNPPDAAREAADQPIDDRAADIEDLAEYQELREWGQVLSLMFFGSGPTACGDRPSKTLKTRPDPSTSSKNTSPVDIFPARPPLVKNRAQNTMIWRRPRWLFGLLAGAVVLAAAFAFYSFTILFDEALYTNEGTFAYYLAVPNLIADAPRPGQVGEPRFYVTAGDGPKAPASAVHYRSNAESEEFFRALETYLRSEGLIRAGTLAEIYPTEWALHQMHGEGAIVYRPEAGTPPQHVIVRIEGIDGAQSDISITATY